MEDNGSLPQRVVSGAALPAENNAQSLPPSVAAFETVCSGVLLYGAVSVQYPSHKSGVGITMDVISLKGAMGATGCGDICARWCLRLAGSGARGG